MSHECPACMARVPDRAKHCAYCGAPLEVWRQVQVQDAETLGRAVLVGRRQRRVAKALWRLGLVLLTLAVLAAAALLVGEKRSAGSAREPGVEAVSQFAPAKPTGGPTGQPDLTRA